MTKKPINGRPGVLGLTVLASAFAFAGQFAMGEPAAKPIEEMVVTGSYIKGNPKDAALPVGVTTQQDLLDIGSPNITELVRDLNVSRGNDSEENQFDGRSAGAGVSTINLRGLGAARTLILWNTRRQVSSEGSGVDINAMPASALERVEILKDGAAALYGSDAIAGVVNMITRDSFRGFEINATHSSIKETDGDSNVSAIYGWGGDSMSAILAVEYQRRSELRIKDRKWAYRPYGENNQGGWSGIGNPGTIFNGAATSADPGCAVLGGQPTRAGLPVSQASATGCAFQFTYFDNIVNKQDDFKSFSAYDWDINDHMRLHLEGLASLMKANDWRTSPSYPPQSLFGADRLIFGADRTLADGSVVVANPGLVSLRAQNPDLVGAGKPLGAAGSPLFDISRYLGVSGLYGNSQYGHRETRTYRLGGELSGSLFNEALNYNFAVNWSQRGRYTTGTDMPVEKMALALDGFGGPNCNTATGTAGQGGCLFYNPFSNAIQKSAINGATNPNYDPSVANKPELINWLFEVIPARATYDLLTWDLTFNGDAGIKLDGGNVQWVLGAQIRREGYQLQVGDRINLALYPCQFYDPKSVALGNVTQAQFDASKTGNCSSRTGLYAFGSATSEVNTQRNIYAVFGELKLPISDSLEARLAVRYEDYGGNTGSSVDPKLAVRWKATDWLAFRASASTTFRGPPQSFLDGRTTSLNFIGAANAFKAVDLIGNPGLKPETAVTTNVGAIIEVGSLYASVDYWHYKFKDAIQPESFVQILAAYTAQGCQNGGAGAPQTGVDGGGLPIFTPTAKCTALRSHVFNTGTAPSGLVRVDTNWINGGRIDNDGIDAQIQYEFKDVMGGNLTLAADGSYILQFLVDAPKDINGVVLGPKRDYVTKLNDGLSYRSMPQLKANASARYVRGPARLTYTLRYIDGVTDDTGPSRPSLAHVDHMYSSDITLNYALFEGKANVMFSVLNIFDKDPPQASLDVNYDPFNYNPLGRVYKIGFTYTLGDG